MTEPTARQTPGVRPDWLTPSLLPAESHFLDVDGCTIHYLDEGAGDPLLFLHPAPSCAFMYREFVAGLSPRYRCIAVDYPGFGLSTAAPGFAYGLEDQAQVLAGFVAKLDLRNITLLVHDAGGPIGMGAAVRDPDRYRAFVISDTFAFPLRRFFPILVMLRLVSSRPGRWLNRRLNLLPWAVATLAPVGRRLPKPIRRAYLRFFETVESRDRIMHLFSRMARSDAYLSELETAVKAKLGDRRALILFGQFDPVRLLGFARRWRAIFPRHTTDWVPLEGHFPHEGNPEWMMRAIRRWKEGDEKAERSG